MLGWFENLNRFACFLRIAAQQIVGREARQLVSQLTCLIQGCRWRAPASTQTLYGFGVTEIYSMAFYIVVHHPSDPNRLWANEWEAQTLLRSITTPKNIGVRLAEAKAKGERIYVH